jgi:hypothetical protein
MGHQQSECRPRRRYSDEDRAVALAALAANGNNLRRTARQLGIPRASLLAWRNGGRRGACRHCYDLTYTSCQESRKYDSLHRFMAREMGEDFASVKRRMQRLGKRKW